MITIANALEFSLNWLQSEPAGKSISLPLAAAKSLNLVEWCALHDLNYSVSEDTLTLTNRVDGKRYVSPDPTIPPPGTPINKLHPGNRFRLLAGLPLLPQDKA